MKKVDKTKKRNKKILLFVFLVLIILVIVSSCFIILKATNKKEESQGGRCPYSVEEVYRFIEEDLFDEEKNKHETPEQAKMGYVLTHFYDCFDKSNKFLMPINLENFSSPAKEFMYVSYDEYLEVVESFDDFMNKERIERSGEIVYYRTAKLFMYVFGFQDNIEINHLDEENK